MTKRIAIAELEGVALDSAMQYLFGAAEADRYARRAEHHKRHRMLWAHQSGFVEVPDELVEGE